MAEEDDRPKGQTISVQQAATLLNRSVRWVQNLVQNGYVVRSKAGQYSVVEVVRGALAHYENLIEKSSKSAAASRVTDARTREIEMRIAERQRELIPLEDAKAVIAQFAAQVRAELTGLPSRLTRDLDMRRKLEQEVDGSLRRLSAQANASAVTLDTGSVDIGASAEVPTGRVGGAESDLS